MESENAELYFWMVVWLRLCKLLGEVADVGAIESERWKRTHFSCSRTEFLAYSFPMIIMLVSSGAFICIFLVVHFLLKKIGLINSGVDNCDHVLPLITVYNANNF